MTKARKNKASKDAGKGGSKHSERNKGNKASTAQSPSGKIDEAQVTPLRVTRSTDKNNTVSTPTQASETPTTPQAQANAPIEGNEESETMPPQTELSEDGGENEWSKNGGGNIGEIIGMTAIDLAKWNSEITNKGEADRREYLDQFQHDIVKVPNETLQKCKDGIYLLHLKRTYLAMAGESAASCQLGMFQH